MDAINESDEDEDEEDDENVPGPPSTVKKQPVSSRHRKQSTVVKSKAPLIASTAGNAQETAVKKSKSVPSENLIFLFIGVARCSVYLPWCMMTNQKEVAYEILHKFIPLYKREICFSFWLSNV